MVKPLTLCVVHDDTHILLGYKKRGYGAGRWNGFGGKVHPGEPIEAAARRELREEAGIEAGTLDKRAVLRFETFGEADILEVHVFQVASFVGKPVESDEMRPQWFKLAEIPYARMWPDDRHWLPMLLEGKRFEGSFTFLDQDTILHLTLREELLPA